jgi:phage-related protein
MNPTIDFSLETRRAEKATIDSLNFMIKDALEAFEATGLGKYSDQLSVYRSELKKKKLHISELKKRT